MHRKRGIWWIWRVLLCLLILHPAALAASSGPAADSHSPALSSVLPTSYQGVFESETDDLLIAPIGATWNPSTLLRSRPLILDWMSNPAFQINSARQPLSEAQAKIDLERFLNLRGVDTIIAAQILSRFDDPAVIQIVSAPSLRAALLMLSELDPYQAVVSSLLEGENETGLPFAAVEFADLGVENAVATIQPPSQANGWRFQLQISSQFEAEPPVQLIPALVHESLHGDGENSGPEEVIANILDTIAYGEMLLIDPDAVYAGTQLAAYNNLQLYSLLNSMGPRGGGHIGISTSVIGDVFVGPGLEDFDAGSIRDSILQDPFYGSLGAVDSPIPPTASALIQRFPGQTSLGAQPHF
ncbi:MAG: hypothetical protein AB7G88_13295, partial [Thermomicrobiales bacterium]